MTRGEKWMPSCPVCGSTRSLVRQTRRYGVPDPTNQANRERECRDCHHKWWGIEPAQHRERTGKYRPHALETAARLRTLLGPPPEE